MGIIGAFKFAASEDTQPEMSEDERIAETMRKRHAHDEPKVDPDISLEAIAEEDEPKSTRNPLRELFLLIILLGAAAFYFHDVGLLKPTYEIVNDYWSRVFGYPTEKKEIMPSYEDEINELEGLLSNEAFDSLMPVTDDIAALADSIATISIDSMGVEIQPETLYVKYTITDSVTKFLPVEEEPIDLSDDDIKIINNASMLLMLIDIIDIYPPEYGSGNIFLKRDAIKVTAPSGGMWVQFVKRSLDRFVLGNFDENYNTGNVILNSKFEIIMNAEKDFQAQLLDKMGLLDVLAHPFNKYLEQIVIDLGKGIDNNPAQFIFAGTSQQIQYILSSWAETRTNILLRSAEVEYHGQELVLTLDVLFFNYSQ